MKVEDIIEDIKVKRPSDQTFQQLYREWKLNITEDKDQGETLGKILIYLQENSFLTVWGEEMDGSVGLGMNRSRPKSPYVD